MTVSHCIKKMIDFYDGSIHDINHFLKVYTYAKTIGELEGLDEQTQLNLELAAIVHDIACPLCREKYGAATGRLQEIEGVPLVLRFLGELGFSMSVIDRVCWLVGHHHTYECISGLDHCILLEADFLVNADEAGLMPEAIIEAKNQRFKTNAGIQLLESVYSHVINA